MDDVKYYAKLVEANLCKEGYEGIKTFYNGEDVISSLKEDSPDCVILDHILTNEGINGNDVLSYIKKNNPKTKVIILSGQVDVNVATGMMKNGAHDYIIKNDMALFNLINSIKRLENSISESEMFKRRKKIINFLYFFIIALWVGIIIHILT